MYTMTKFTQQEVASFYKENKTLIEDCSADLMQQSIEDVEDQFVEFFNSRWWEFFNFLCSNSAALTVEWVATEMVHMMKGTDQGKMV